jgi:methylated-DNA-[protein]-cysteine S-methyltransferase
VSNRLVGCAAAGDDPLGPGRNVSAPRDNGTVTELAWATLGSPVGEISVACTAAGVARIRFGLPPARPGQAHASLDEAEEHHVNRACAQLTEYFGGRRRAFDLPVDWSGVSPAQRQVLPVLWSSVGYGETVTYGELARRAGLTGDGAVPVGRVVGQIMGSNPCPIIVPCHRVVASDGLGGFSGGTGPETKRWLLIFEGAEPPTLDWDPAGLSVAGGR